MDGQAPDAATRGLIMSCYCNTKLQIVGFGEIQKCPVLTGRFYFAAPHGSLFNYFSALDNSYQYSNNCYDKKSMNKTTGIYYEKANQPSYYQDNSNDVQ